MIVFDSSTSIRKINHEEYYDLSKRFSPYTYYVSPRMWSWGPNYDVIVFCEFQIRNLNAITLPPHPFPLIASEPIDDMQDSCHLLLKGAEAPQEVQRGAAGWDKTTQWWVGLSSSNMKPLCLEHSAIDGWSHSHSTIVSRLIPDKPHDRTQNVSGHIVVPMISEDTLREHRLIVWSLGVIYHIYIYKI